MQTLYWTDLLSKDFGSNEPSIGKKKSLKNKGTSCTNTSARQPLALQGFITCIYSKYNGTAIMMNKAMEE